MLVGARSEIIKEIYQRCYKLIWDHTNKKAIEVEAEIEIKIEVWDTQ